MKSIFKKYARAMIKGLKKYYFIFLIFFACFLGYILPEYGIALSNYISYYIAILIFLMSYTLPSDSLARQLKDYKPVLFIIFFNYIAMPFFGYFSALLFLKENLFNGFIIMMSVSTTLASCIIWTRLGSGNESLALLSGVAINLMSAFVTPLLLFVILKMNVSLPVIPMIKKLFIVIFLPTLIGQAARKLNKKIAESNKKKISFFSKLIILAAIYSAFSKISGRLSAELIVLIPFIILFKAMMLAISYFSSSLFNFSKKDRIAIMFVSTQKTLPMAILIALTYFNPETALPITAYHVLQLIIDSFAAEIVKSH